MHQPDLALEPAASADGAAPEGGIAVTTVGQLIAALQGFPTTAPVEAGVGHRDGIDTHAPVTVTAAAASWLARPGAPPTVLILGESGTVGGS